MYGNFGRHFGRIMKYQRMSKVSAAAVLALSAFSLAGCGTWNSVIDYVFNDREEKCPDAMVLADAAVLPAFDPAKDGDPTNIVYTAKLKSSNLSCDFRKKQNKATSEIEIAFHATRPAGGPKAVYRVPYFVALTTNGRVLEKKSYWQEIEFREGVSSVDVTTTQDDIELKPRRGRAVINYHYVVGFQLTQSQIAYNKKMGQYEP